MDVRGRVWSTETALTSLSTLKGKDARLIFHLTSKKLDNTVYHHAVSLP